MKKHNLIERYDDAERIIHWIVAITFVLLALSGLALFHPSLFFLSSVLGGGTWTRILHPFIGLVMFVAFCGLAVRVWRANILDRKDKQWLKQADDVIANREEFRAVFVPHMRTQTTAHWWRELRAGVCRLRRIALGSQRRAIDRTVVASIESGRRA